MEVRYDVFFDMLKSPIYRHSIISRYDKLIPAWEEKDEEEVVDLSAAVQKRKKRSPAAATPSRRRLQQWQEKKNRSRLEGEQRTTPLRLTEQMKGTRLIQGWKKRQARLGGELFTREQAQVGWRERLCSFAIIPKLLCIHSRFSHHCQVLLPWPHHPLL